MDKLFYLSNVPSIHQKLFQQIWWDKNTYMTLINVIGRKMHRRTLFKVKFKSYEVIAKRTFTLFLFILLSYVRLLINLS